MSLSWIEGASCRTRLTSVCSTFASKYGSLDAMNQLALTFLGPNSQQEYPNAQLRPASVSRNVREDFTVDSTRKCEQFLKLGRILHNFRTPTSHHCKFPSIYWQFRPGGVVHGRVDDANRVRHAAIVLHPHDGVYYSGSSVPVSPMGLHDAFWWLETWIDGRVHARGTYADGVPDPTQLKLNHNAKNQNHLRVNQVSIN